MEYTIVEIHTRGHMIWHRYYKIIHLHIHKVGDSVFSQLFFLLLAAASVILLVGIVFNLFVFV